MKHVIIINPTAGKKNELEDIIKKVDDAFVGLDYQIYVTKAPNDATRFVKEYLENNNEKVRFYSCGGDGTLNEIVNGVMENKNAEIAIYPIGSGNDFLKVYGKIEDFLDFKALINGKTATSDLLKLQDKYVVNIFNIGLDANVVYYQRKLKKLPLMSPKGAYNLGVFCSLLQKLNHKHQIYVDDELIYDGKVTLCAICNGKCYGGGYYCAPIAKVDDGILDVCFVKKVSRITFAKLVKVYKAGKHLETKGLEKYVGYKQGKKVEVKIDKPLWCSIDGELTKTDHFVVEIIHNAIQFVVPEIDKK